MFNILSITTTKQLLLSIFAEHSNFIYSTIRLRFSVQRQNAAAVDNLGAPETFNRPRLMCRQQLPPKGGLISSAIGEISRLPESFIGCVTAVPNASYKRFWHGLRCANSSCSDRSGATCRGCGYCLGQAIKSATAAGSRDKLMTPKLTAISGAIQRNLESAIIVNPAEQNEALRKLCDRHLY